MDVRLQVRVQRYGWDAAAAYYHDGWQAQLRPAHDQLLEMLVLCPGHKVIETACGTGLVTRRIADAVGPHGAVLATDLSQKMIDELDCKLEEYDHLSIRIERMAADCLDVPEATFDAGICALGLMYVPDPRAAVAELARVVRPRGTVAATVWGERRNCGWADVFSIVDAHVASEVCPLFFATGAKGALVADFEAAGLHEIEERRHFEMLSFRNSADVTNSILLGGPVALAVKRFSEEVWEDVVREFLASVAEYRVSDGGYHIPAEFVTVRGTR